MNKIWKVRNVIVVLILLLVGVVVSQSEVALSENSTSSDSVTVGEDYIRVKTISEYQCSYDYDTSCKGNNKAEISVYGFQLDPTKDKDYEHDYYIFLIWVTAKPNTDEGWSMRTKDKTMEVEFSLEGEGEILPYCIKPVEEQSQKGETITYSLGISVGSTAGASAEGVNIGVSAGVSAGISWSQFVPQWEVRLADTEFNEEGKLRRIKWEVKINEDEYKKSCFWGFGVGVCVPEGKWPTLTARATSYFQKYQGLIWGYEVVNASPSILDTFCGARPKLKISVAHPSSITLDKEKEIRIEVKVENKGGSPPEPGWIEISFPDDPSNIENIEIDSYSGFSGFEIKELGEDEAEYPFVKATADFIPDPDKKYYLAVKVEPKEAGYFTFRVKAGWGDLLGFSHVDWDKSYKVCVNSEWETVPDNPCKERRLTCDGSYEYRNKTNGTDCCCKGNCDGWYDTGEIRWVEDPQNSCYEKEQKEQEYRDYYCYEGSCIYEVTDTRWVDTGEKREKIKDLKISPESKTICVGDELNLKVTAIYASGKSKDVTGKASWSSSDSSILRSEGSGKFKALSKGSVTITARYCCKLATATITIKENEAPIASFTCSPEIPFVDQNITFDASSSYDPDGEIVKYEWDFGDASTAQGKSVTHSYNQPGDYEVTLIITDDKGAQSSTSMTITVLEEFQAGLISPSESFLPSLEGYPDLAISSYDFSFACDEPSKLTIKAVIHNIGEADAVSAEVSFYDGDPDEGGVLIGEQDLAGIPAGGAAEAQIVWSFGAAEKGEHEIFVRISDCQPQESDETNNTASKVFLLLPGDANGDGKVNALDITKVERIIAKFDPLTCGADANRDGKINALDITKVERIIAKLD